MKIAVIDDYQDAFSRLGSFAKLKGNDVRVFHAPAESEDALVEMLAGAEAVILTMQRTALPGSVLARLPDLKMISQTGRNTAHLDLAACKERGIVVSAGGAGGGNATAELAWGLILSAARHIPEEVQALKEGRWQTTLGTGLAGKTLGVYAYGRIGSIVAQVGRAFGMKVICWGRDGSTAKAKEAGFEVAASREAFFETADVVSLHIPLNKDTQGIVTAADLARMKSDAIVVNTSRAPLIEAGALLAALKAGRPGRAAVDVYETEPVLRGAHPLLKLPNVVATPHLGYVEKDTYEALFGAATDQVLAFAAGKPINVVAT
ncbi:MAG: serA 1 [Xanthobacteraceae bacterium]|nr:serA 1 [Xanthobacteraceae bacterium]